MNKLKEIYREMISAVKESNLISYDTVKFGVQIGRHYPVNTPNAGLMVIGRSCNGWTAYSDDVDELFAEGKTSMFSTEPFSFLREEKSRYNPKRSAFWRVVKAIATEFYGKKQWSDYIAWSNLYKVSPEGGNPSRTLGGLQYKHCVEILRHDVEMLSPGIIVFLTGDDNKEWLTEDFLNVCGAIDLYTFTETRWDKHRLLYSKISNDRVIIITEHPQGKKEQPHIDAILDCIRRANIHLY